MRLLFIVLTFCLLNSSFDTKADTIDVWQVRRNGKLIINSNEVLIAIKNQPMIISLSLFETNDTIQIEYWTDSRLEEHKWHFYFKDSNNVLLCTYTNSIDSSMRCIPPPCIIFTRRKGYIPFIVGNLRAFLIDKNIKRIFVQFESDDPRIGVWGEQYANKNVCIISDE
jgi:hypothetical protein